MMNITKKIMMALINVALMIYIMYVGVIEFAAYCMVKYNETSNAQIIDNALFGGVTATIVIVIMEVIIYKVYKIMK